MNILKKALNSRIFENFVSLSIVHYLNYIIPLFTVPYTVRVLGPEKYGLMAFSSAIIFYFSIIVDYGFNYSATKDISLNRSNVESISRIFSETVIVKLFFFVLCGIFMMSLTIFLKNFAKERLFYFISFLTIIGNVLIPSFIFQGIEKMKILSFSSLISKTVSIFGLFYFVNEPSDYILIPIISCFGIFFSLLISYFYLFKKVKIFFIMPDIKGLIKSVEEGKEMFFSIISSSLYTSSNVVLIGIFAGQEKAAFYSCAEKIIKSFLGLFSPLFQSLYPYMVEKINFNPKECVQNLKKYLPIFFTFSFFCSALIFLFSSDIINFLFGWEYMASVKALKIMSFIIFLVSVSNILGTQIMIPLNFKKEFLFIISSAGLLAVTGMIATSAKYHVEGAALIFLLSEIYVSCAMIFFIIKKKILFWI